VEAATGSNPGWNSDVEFDKKMMVERYIHLEYFHIYRTLYRSQVCSLDGRPHALSCPESCDEDSAESDCTCTCTGIDASNDNANFDWENMEPCLYASDTSATIFQTLFSEEARKDAITMFCSAGVKEGEMLESASPGDPLFWMIHPVLDRMITAKRLAGVSHLTFGNYGQFRAFEDESWLDYSFYNTDTYYCEGHSMYDEVLVDLNMPSHLVASADANGDGVLNNIEFYEGTDPTKGDAATYIYDKFTWDHCDKNDAAGQEAFTTGYLDGSSASGEDSGSADSGMTFAGGVTPGTWGGDSYKSIKQSSVRPSVSIEEHRNAVKAGLKPGKSLAKTPRSPGSAEDYNKVMELLEKGK